MSLVPRVGGLVIAPLVVGGAPAPSASAAPRAAIAAGEAHTCAIEGDGTAACWGRNAEAQAAVPAGLGTVRSITTGYYETYAVKTSGFAAGWGRFTSGYPGIPPGPAPLDAVVGEAYEHRFVRYSLPGTFSVVEGALPSGLTLSAAGRLTGTPMAAGDFTFTVRVEDGLFEPTQAQYTVTMLPERVEATVGWSGSSAGVKGDFDGDGFGDLAIGVPGEDVGLAADAGLVQVLYGTATGLDASGSRAWSQNSLGMADNVEAGDGFGAALAVGDVNADGFGDLVVGVPGENIGSLVDGGVMQVLLGSASGLTGTESQLWSQNSAGIAERAETGDRFGSVLATGMLDDDAFADVVAGVPAEDVNLVADAGIVQVIPGAAAGLTATGSQYWSQNTGGIHDSVEAGDGFGGSLAVADMAATSVHDLVIGAPGEDFAAVVDAGVVHLLHGEATGPSAAGSRLWSQDSTGIADGAETGDRFGTVLAAGRLDDDAFADLAVGVPDESVGTAPHAGIVHIIRGASAGLSAAGSLVWRQGVGGVGDAAEAGDAFGAAVAIADLGAGSIEEVAVGVPGEDFERRVDAGVLHLLPETPGQPTTGERWSQSEPEINDVAESGDRFASALTTGRLDGDAYADLLVGVPGESVGTVPGAGSVQVLPGGTGGLSRDDQLWSQSSVGITDSAETGDGFGSGLGR